MKQVHCIVVAATQCRLSVEVEIGIAPTAENKKRREKCKGVQGGVGLSGSLINWPGLKRLPEETLPA